MIDQAIRTSIQNSNKTIGQLDAIRQELKENPRTIVVLDDDPTGTQTVYNVPVVTQWSQEVLDREVAKSPVFFILTNSRSLQSKEADELGNLLGKRLRQAASKHNKKLLVISRGDSTLRGHYPNEVDALAEGLEWQDAKHFLIPAFFEGGRYTYNDVHYVQEGDTFIPAAETPFAKDNTFGYAASNLKEWIHEKTNAKTTVDAITSFDLSLIRKEATEQITQILDGTTNCFVGNATTYGDLGVLALASLKAKSPIIFRTAASFVNAISAIEPKAPLQKEALNSNENTNGGLVIVGSYVPKTSAQLAYIKIHNEASFLELDIAKLITQPNASTDLQKISRQIDTFIADGKNVVLYTGRKVITGDTKAESLKIVNQVSQFLIDIVHHLKNTPRYILAKGGITSSDIAVKGLSVKRALVLGQIIKGVPVWQLKEEAKFPNTPYIVFPGNVGDEAALSTTINLLK